MGNVTIRRASVREVEAETRGTAVGASVLVRRINDACGEAGWAARRDPSGVYVSVGLGRTGRGSHNSHRAVYRGDGVHGVTLTRDDAVDLARGILEMVGED